MSWLDFFRSKKAKPSAKRTAFSAANLNRLTVDWTTDLGTVNRWLRWELRTLRLRSRALVRSDSYANKYINACVDNIAGPYPFILEGKIKFDTTGLPNDAANDQIEDGWEEWSKPGNCDVTGKLSLPEIHRSIIRGLARDGEVLIRKYIGPQYGPYGIQLQLLDIERLDEQKNDLLTDGAIKMGVEVDMFSRPRAYHILRDNPGELGEWSRGSMRDYERVPANQVTHLFIADWPEQVRGVPWLNASMTRLYQLGKFEEAALIAARVGASQMGVIYSESGDAPPIGQEILTSEGQAASDGTPLLHAEPGAFPVLGPGYRLESWNPRYPDAQVEPFIRACLRGASAGVRMAYHSFANDSGSVNYSTARVALLEERDMWSSIQRWYVEHFCDQLFLSWLGAASLSQALPGIDRPRNRKVKFIARTWDWIDPQKEMDAKVTALDAQLTSRTRIAAQSGQDFEDIVEELAQEQALMAAKGLEPSNQQPAPNAQEVMQPQEDATDTEEAVDESNS